MCVYVFPIHPSIIGKPTAKPHTYARGMYIQLPLKSKKPNQNKKHTKNNKKKKKKNKQKQQQQKKNNKKKTKQNKTKKKKKNSKKQKSKQTNKTCAMAKSLLSVNCEIKTTEVSRFTVNIMKSLYYSGLHSTMQIEQRLGHTGCLLRSSEKITVVY